MLCAAGGTDISLFLSCQHAQFGDFSCKKMTIMEAVDMLDHLVDESDPDVDFPNSFHAFQTAEGIRKAHPDKGLFPSCSGGCAASALKGESWGGVFCQKAPPWQKEPQTPLHSQSRVCSSGLSLPCPPASPVSLLQTGSTL